MKQNLQDSILVFQFVSFFSRLIDLDREEDSQFKNLENELIKLGKQKIPFHFTIFFRPKIDFEETRVRKKFRVE